MLNIPSLEKTLEERTPLPYDRQKWKRTKDPINSMKTATDEKNYENYEVKYEGWKVKQIKYRTSGKNPLLVDDILMQQIQANVQLVQKWLPK